MGRTARPGPLALGVKALITAVRSRNAGEQPSPVVAAGAFSVTAVTIANGVDNISVYAPVFRTLGPADSLITIAVFAVLVAVWWATGALLGHRRVITVVARFGHWLVPVVFITIGAVILTESGVIGRCPACPCRSAPATPRPSIVQI